jgi:hypothetical protein
MTWAVERVDVDAMEEARERVMVEIGVVDGEMRDEEL